MAIENRRLSVDHSREVWLRIDIADCPKRKKRRPARTHTVFACFAWAALRIMEIKHLTWLQLKKRLVDMPAGCYAPLIFLMYFEKCSMMNSSASGKAKRYTAHKKNVRQKALHGMFLRLNWKTSFYCRFNFAMRWQPNSLKKLTPITFLMSSRRRNRREQWRTEYYWHQISILASCKFVKDLQMSTPSDFKNRGRAHISSRTLCSLPVTLLSSP
jgi:hypothetical protein